MEADAGVARAGADRGDLLEGVNGAGFGRLRYRHGVRLGSVADAALGPPQRRRQRRRFQFSMGSG